MKSRALFSGCVDLPGRKAQHSSDESGGGCELKNLATDLQARAEEQSFTEKDY